MDVETTENPNITMEAVVWKDYSAVMEALGIMFIFVGSLGVLGNGFVLIVMFCTKNLRQRLANILIINQSLLDFVAGLLLVTDTASKFDPDREYDWNGIGGELHCRLWRTRYGSPLVWSILKSSTYNLVAITAERYLMVVYPVVHKLSYTRKKALLVAVMVWFVGVAWEFPTAVPRGAVVDGRCDAFAADWSPQWVKAYGFLTIVIGFFIPVVIHPALYTHMMVALTKGKNKIAPGSDGGTTNSGTQPKLTRTQKNLFKTMALVTIGFFLCWSWNQMYFFFHNLGLVEQMTPFHYFSMGAANLNCCINPVIYLFMYRDFRKAAKKTFLRQVESNPSTVGTVSATDATT